MVARLSGSGGEITFHLRDRDPYEGVWLQVTARVQLAVGNEIAATHHGVWFLEEAVEGFLRDWARLDETRQSPAQLRSMSPGEFDLVLRPIDRLGHCAAEIAMNMDDNVVKLVFELDADRIAQFREEFEQEVKGGEP